MPDWDSNRDADWVFIGKNDLFDGDRICISRDFHGAECGRITGTDTGEQFWKTVVPRCGGAFYPVLCICRGCSGCPVCWKSGADCGHVRKGHKNQAQEPQNKKDSKLRGILCPAEPETQPRPDGYHHFVPCDEYYCICCPAEFYGPFKCRGVNGRNAAGGLLHYK